MGLRAALVRRFLTDQLEFVNIAKEYLDGRGLPRAVPAHRLPAAQPRPPRRQGGRPLPRLADRGPLARVQGRCSATSACRAAGYIPSDGILDFIHHNDLEDVYNRKYVDPDRVRLDYPYIVQLFKNSFFSPDILRGLSDVLDDLEGRPIIVRSSSLLEDRLGAAFSGQVQEPVPRQHRHQARAPRRAHRRDRRGVRLRLQPRPDRVPRAARAPRPARGDGHPHPGGGRARGSGRYWMPAFSGVGFSNNEFRWSARIGREDGLLRIVPGLGTRAVDRLADDYPVLVAPGPAGPARQPDARGGACATRRRRPTSSTSRRASSRPSTCASCSSGYGDEMPLVRQMISIADHDHLRRPVGLVDFSRRRRRADLRGAHLGQPVRDAHARRCCRCCGRSSRRRWTSSSPRDGQHVYLLQCRPQGATEGAAPVADPARPAARPRAVHRAPLRLERPA